MGGTSLDRVREWVDPHFNSLLDLIFPRRCAGCGRAGEVWCLTCHSKLERFAPGSCQGCGRPLFGKGFFCQDCLALESTVPIGCYARYRHPLRRALLALKYRPDEGLAAVMARWMAEVWRRTGWQASLIVPVPLSQARLRERGFNQANLIGKALAEELELAYQPDAVKRLKDTHSQVGLNYQQRRRNVAGAFRAEASLITGERVLVVDDLCTTGSTMVACWTALEAAEVVYGMAVARA